MERDDETVLQTHTLADGETSFTFTQTETSYATFNYVVKINDTQTDTYSATYTPPPTPTFDIALTNDDLAITATLTNIVNPDPYYTLMIHDANDTHLDGHTFATGDTTVVLTWTETSYGEKTYTKLLNGASIGTETITLTDPNASSTTYNLDSNDFPIITPSSGDWSSWAQYRKRSDDSAYVYYDLWNTGAANGGDFSYSESDNTNNDGGYQIRVSKTTGDWSDYPHTGTHPPTGVSTTNGNVALGTLFTFVKPSGTGQTPWMSDQNEAPSTATFNPPTSYTITGPPSNGYYPGYEIIYDASSILPSGYPGTSGTKYYYGIGASGSIFSGGYYFYWDSSNNTWNDAAAGDGQADPVSFSYSATPVVNGTIITGIGGAGADFIFTMSGIVSSSTPPPDIQPIVNTGGSWNGVHSWASPTTETINGSVEYHYKLSFDTNSRIAYRTIDKTWYDADTSSQPTALSSDAFSTQSLALVNPQYVWIGDTSATNTDFYLSFDNPYYEAPA